MRLLHLVAVLLQVGDEFLGSPWPGNPCVATIDGGRMRGVADRLKSCGIIFQVRREHGRGNMRAHAAGKQGVAVRRRRRDARAAERAAGAADILDHQLLAERLAHMLGDDPRDHVARAAGGERHHHRDGPRRIALRRHFRWRGTESAVRRRRVRPFNVMLLITQPPLSLCRSGLMWLSSSPQIASSAPIAPLFVKRSNNSSSWVTRIVTLFSVSATVLSQRN